MGLSKLSRNKRFNYAKNCKNVRRRAIAKKRRQRNLVKLTEEAKALAQHWNSSKGLKENMETLGLVADCSKAIPIQKTTLKNVDERRMNEKKPTSQQKEVHKILEDIAANEFHKEWSVSQEDIHFAVHMFDRHELDFAAMVRDRKNVYQLTSGQIRQKLRMFRMSKVPWEWYCKDRQERHLPPLDFKL
ncbi:Oidioi.mRNA.OKI2018_I69.XSR.g16701.t1.cds [Oikopleura dioica]|uniref:Nucleolar protein 16 n=1 Tax=Oikopleura dioica TaxID=34765 RepID=A0ABN7SL64_OIKDI|nr:Oidioi.mRNA.OKI2018_I69.XSR.g16701.t1.cds [Oikopleura dioica]